MTKADEWHRQDPYIDEKFREAFPGYESATRDADWRVVRDAMSVGDEVHGIVVFKSPFGAWIDIGNGFPALLKIPYVAGLNPKDYKRGAWCPEGSEITACIRAFADRDHQVMLTQKELDLDLKAARAAVEKEDRRVEKMLDEMKPRGFLRRLFGGKSKRGQDR